MDNTTAFCKAFLADECGVTAIEYGLLAALITIAAIAGISATGVNVLAMYDYWSAAVVAALGGA